MSKRSLRMFYIPILNRGNFSIPLEYFKSMGWQQGSLLHYFTQENTLFLELADAADTTQVLHVSSNGYVYGHQHFLATSKLAIGSSRFLFYEPNHKYMYFVIQSD